MILFNFFLIIKLGLSFNFRFSSIKKLNSLKYSSIKNNDNYLLGFKPRLNNINQNGELTWYAIGLPEDFNNIPQKITIRDVNYIIWKNDYVYYGLKDVCSHQGSSFQGGYIINDTINCPYHGYVFNGTCGELIKIPDINNNKNKCYNVKSFKVVEKNDIVYINTIPITLENYYIIDPKYIWVEPESTNPVQKAVILTEIFEHYAKFVTVNSLDICHIGFVHTFGNRNNPNPVSNTRIQKCNDSNFHYKISYEYLAGKKSLVSSIYNFSKITVENEYVQPHTTVARVLFGNFSSTIITIAQPISKFKTKLFVKAYRNYWYFNNSTNFLEEIRNIIINKIGDLLTYYTMYETLKQDKNIVDNIDKTNYIDMHGQFNTKYDMMSTHYKHNYKKYFELDNQL
jgi:phenylpropionate dioxygenase-like ring-hydroxylating dioxygenase large terminal subunit